MVVTSLNFASFPKYKVFIKDNNYDDMEIYFILGRSLKESELLGGEFSEEMN